MRSSEPQAPFPSAAPPVTLLSATIDSIDPTAANLLFDTVCLTADLSDVDLLLWNGDGFESVITNSPPVGTTVQVQLDVDLVHALGGCIATRLGSFTWAGMAVFIGPQQVDLLPAP